MSIQRSDKAVKLRTKLWISFGCIIVVPIILLIVFANLLVIYQLNVINETYNIESTIEDIFPNSTRLFNRLTGEIQKAIQLEIEQDPDMFQRRETLEELSNQLKNKNTSLVVRKNDQIIYSSSDDLEEIYGELPLYGEGNNEVLNGQYFGGKEARLVKAQDFKFSDGADGTVFIITSLNSWIPELKTMVIQLIAAVILILILTASIFSY